ncbi:hypothetical protein AgCh_015212 [Apium graveolens]
MGHFKFYSPHKPFKFLIFFWVFASVFGSELSGPDSDKSALLEMKASVSDPTGMLSSWQSASVNHCSWFGVSCDANSRVLAVNVTGGGGNSGSFSCDKYAKFSIYGFGIRRVCSGNSVVLSGKISPGVVKLSELRVLSLPFNGLSGEIPGGIWGMEKLEVLDLEGNSIGGVLPSDIKGLRNLRVLNLGFNEIVGEIPSSLSGCGGLQVLNLAGNQLNGTIPVFLGKFGDLRGVYLSFNRLSGQIPPEIGFSCRKLEHLELASNYLVGGIPSSLGNCSMLQSLLLYSNILEEVIPMELGQLSKLQVLDVSRNSLSGMIPPELGKCSELSVVVFSNLWDPLSGGAESESDLSPTSGHMEFNFFQGTIPTGLVTLPKLKVLWAPRATLEGKLPSDWGTCNSLEMVNLAENYFMGEIPVGLTRCKGLYFLDLSSNRLTGGLVGSLQVPCMTLFDVSSNFLSGSMPLFNSSACPLIPSISHKSFEPYTPSTAYVSFLAYGARNATSFPSFGDVGNLAILHNFGGNNFTGGFSSVPISRERLGSHTVYAFLAGQNKMSGPIPGGLFGKCEMLKGFIVNVSGNELSGQFPPQIGSMCRSLIHLDTSRNQIAGAIPNFGAGNNLTGPVPASLWKLQSLEVLDVSSNSLSGEIPDTVVHLTNLTTLLLNNNKFSGQLPPGLANVTTLSVFNVSFNNLSGPVPLNSNSIKCNDLVGNPFLQPCRVYSLSGSSSDQQGGNFENDAASPSVSENSKKSSNNGFNSIEIASITSASAIVSVLLALIVLFFYTRKWHPKSRVGGSIRKEVTVFTDIGVPLSFENVVRATGSFNASNCIGNGGFGATYKAEISPGVLVAIKRLSVGRFQGVQQFDAEIKTLGRLRHPNLVTLIGYHASETEMFLIYNYLPGGNLEKFIQERSTRAVDWRILHKIALDIARALAYLHDQCVPRVLHRDVKPSNILLDEDFNAYLSDFGLARLLGTSETHATTGVAGTFGYVAPEYAMTCRVSDKADVYSYGVVLLELISDKKALDPSFSSYGNGFNIVAWACMLLRQGRAKEFFTAGLWDAGPHDDLVEVLHLAVVCTVETLSTRPTMKQVVRRLKQLQPASC